MEIKELSMSALRCLFEERKRLLLEVRDEIDRRESEKPAAKVEWTKYVENGDTD